MAKSVAKNAIYSGIRTISFMLFPLITYPYVAHVLMAENLGKIDYAVTTVSYFQLIAALGITTYATRAGAGLREDRKQLDTFASEVFTINMVSTLVAYALLGGLVLLWPHLHGYAALIAIQSLTIIGTTIGVEWLYALEEDFAYITIRTVVVQFISAVLLFTLVHKPEDYWIYAAITVFSGVGGNVFNWLRSGRYANIRLTWNFDYMRHLVPMMVLFGNAVAVTIYVNIDVSLLNSMCGDYEVGIYGLSVKIYRMVKQLLNAIITVSLPRFSLYAAQHDDEKYYGLLGNVGHGLLIVVAPALTMLFLMARDVVLIMGGEGFLASIPSLRILCVAGLFAVAGNFFASAILLPFGQEGLTLRCTVVGAVVNLVTNLFCIPLLGVEGAALTTVLAEACVVGFAIWYSRGSVRLGDLVARVAQPTVTAVLGFVVLAMTHAALEHLPLPWLASFFVRAGALMLVYVALLFVRRDGLAMQLVSSLIARLQPPKET